MAEVGPNHLWPTQKKLILQVLGAMILFSCLAYFIAPSVITLLAGSAFEPSIKVFRLLLPAMIGMTITTLLANQWIGRGIFLTTTIMTLATAIVNIVINFYTIPKYGMMGAVWSMEYHSPSLQSLLSYFLRTIARKNIKKIAVPITDNSLEYTLGLALD